LVEHSLGKGEVTGSNPVISSRNSKAVHSFQFTVLSIAKAELSGGKELRTVCCELSTVVRAGVTQW
jgi:hypothetical protein